MKLVMFTIVLDGEPWIEKHLLVFQQLSIPWRWIVVEGAAGNTADTSWCQAQEPRWSEDGTNEYLCSIRDKRVEHWFRGELWENKTEMCNFALAGIKEPCVLMQIDADEIWNSEQLELVSRMFEDFSNLGSVMFRCRYWVGPNLLLEGDNCYGNNDYEYRRAWRFNPGDKFVSHEPPVLSASNGEGAPKDASTVGGLLFDHYAYATEAQVAYKEKFYGYPGLLNQWRALQAHDKFPVSLSRFFSHVGGELPKVIKLSEDESTSN